MVVPGPGEHPGADNGLAALGHGEGVGRVVVTARGPTQAKPCADALLLRMVKAAVVKPKETRLVFHPNASTVHELLQGSGVFTATPDRPLVTAAVSSRTMSVGALRAGETALHVVDTCIVPRLDITVPVHVMPVAKVVIYMYDKVQVGNSLTGEWHSSHDMLASAGCFFRRPANNLLILRLSPAVVCALDHEGVEFPADQYPFLDLQPNVEDNFVNVKPMKVIMACFFPTIWTASWPASSPYAHWGF